MTKIILTLFLAFVFNGCASYEKFRQVTEEYEIPSKVFNADYNSTWAAIIKVVSKFDLEAPNQEAGFVKSRWIPNTLELNFANSFGESSEVKSARYKFIINAVKGYRYGREVTKVTIYKRQMVEQDFLQGWKEVASDGTLEQRLLYRIGRKITIDKKLREIDKAREQEQLESF